MKTYLADPTGVIDVTLTTFPGREYSIYVAKAPSGFPVAGTIEVFHGDELPVLDLSGQPIAADLATVTGIANQFIAHESSVRILCEDLNEDNAVVISLLPTVR